MFTRVTGAPVVTKTAFLPANKPMLRVGPPKPRLFFGKWGAFEEGGW